MQLSIRSLTKQTSIYGVFQILQRIINFVVIPLYTHYLSPDQFGALDILYLIVWFIGIIGGSKLDAAFIRYYASAKNDGTINNLLSSSIIALVAFATTFCIAAALCARPILEFMFSGKSLPLTGFYLALGATWLELVGSLPLAYFRVRQEAKLVGIISLLQSVLGTAVGVLCVIALGMGFVGILVGILVSGFVLVLLAYWMLFKRTSLSLDFSYGIRLYRYSMPMLAAPLFMYLLNYSDRYFLMKYRTLDEVGVYAMAYKFAMLLSTVVMGPFGEMWGGNQFALHEAKQKQMYQRLALLYVSALCLVALGIIYFSYDLTIFTFDKKFHGLIVAVPALTVGIAIWGIVPTLDFGCQITNKTWIRSITTGIAAISNILFNWLLIPPFGIVGAAFATLFSFILLIWVTYFYNRKLTDYRVDISKAVLLCATLTGFAALIYLQPHLSYVVFTICRLIAIVTFGYLLLRVNELCFRDLQKMVANWARK